MTEMLAMKMQENETGRKQNEHIVKALRQEPWQQETKSPSIAATGSETEPPANQPSSDASIVQELIQETGHFLCLKIGNKLAFVKAL